MSGFTEILYKISVYLNFLNQNIVCLQVLITWEKNIQKIEKDNLKIPLHNVLIAFGIIKADIGICLVYKEWP